MSLVDDLNLEPVGNPVMSKTYSLTYKHIALVKELKGALPVDMQRRVSEGAIVRKAIELLAEQFSPELFVEQEFTLNMREHPAFVSAVGAVRDDDPFTGAVSLSGVFPCRAFAE